MRNRYFISLLALALFSFSLASADGLLLPNQFYGDATYNNAPADGLVVDVYMDGVKVGSTTSADGVYGGGNSTLLLIKDSDGYSVGKIISFFLNGVDTGQTAIFSNGGIIKLDLSATGTISSTGGNSYSSGGGGSSGGSSGGSFSKQEIILNSSNDSVVGNSDDAGDLNVESEVVEGEEESSGFFSLITGAAIGGGAKSGIAALILFGLVGVSFVVVRNRKKKLRC